MEDRRSIAMAPRKVYARDPKNQNKHGRRNGDDDDDDDCDADAFDVQCTPSTADERYYVVYCTPGITTTEEANVVLVKSY